MGRPPNPFMAHTPIQPQLQKLCTVLAEPGTTQTPLVHPYFPINNIDRNGIVEPRRSCIESQRVQSQYDS